MVSPEPDFWIHAVSRPIPCDRWPLRLQKGIEVAKVPRVVQEKGKAKSKEKGKEKGKGKETEMQTGPVYDFLEGSVHDIALRQDILRGYERFKVCGFYRHNIQ